jgi:hypothetical protein
MSSIHMADPRGAPQLIKGFHAIEQNSWRWTMGKFAITLKPPPGASERGGKLSLQVNVPDAVIQNVKATALSASLDGKVLGSATYTAPGEYLFAVEVPKEGLGGEAATFDFALDRFIKAGLLDQRELGVVVTSVALESR